MNSKKTFKLNADYYVMAEKIKGNSNYQLAVSLFKTGDKIMTCGAIIKTDASNEEIKIWGSLALNDVIKFEKPFKFSAIHNATSEQRDFNDMMLKPYQIGLGKYEWTIYEDIRYLAKLRLYNYITYTKRGIAIPCYKYRPFAGTEIGKSIPILNF